MYHSDSKNINRVALECAEKSAKQALDKKALDNISWVFIWFENFINFLNGSPTSKDILNIEKIIQTAISSK